MGLNVQWAQGRMAAVLGFPRETEPMGPLSEILDIRDTGEGACEPGPGGRGVYGANILEMSLGCGHAGRCQGPEEPWRECRARGGKAATPWEQRVSLSPPSPVGSFQQLLGLSWGGPPGGHDLQAVSKGMPAALRHHERAT